MSFNNSFLIIIPFQKREKIDESVGNGVISLAPPSFITVASVSGAEGRGAFPEDEAGIAAYIFTNQTINIEKIKTIFSSVAEVDDNYIIGITQIPDNRCRSDIRSESLVFCYPYGASSNRKKNYL